MLRQCSSTIAVTAPREGLFEVTSTISGWLMNETRSDVRIPKGRHLVVEWDKTERGDAIILMLNDGREVCFDPLELEPPDAPYFGDEPPEEEQF